MHRGRRVPPRAIIFIGCEGKSERAFVRLLSDLCQEAGLHLHLDARPGNGGDSVSVVQEAARHLRKHPDRVSIKHSFVLLDRDRIDQDVKAGRDAAAAASRWKIEIMHLDPNLEGLLLRLHPRQDRRTVAPGDALKELRKVWPEYRKPPTASQLRQRFDLPALRRAARHDQELQELLAILGL